MTTDKTETCARCGQLVEMTTSFQVPGQPPSKPICLECLRKLPKRVAGMVAEKRRREQAR